MSVSIIIDRCMPWRRRASSYSVPFTAAAPVPSGRRISSTTNLSLTWYDISIIAAAVATITSILTSARTPTTCIFIWGLTPVTPPCPTAIRACISVWPVRGLTRIIANAPVVFMIKPHLVPGRGGVARLFSPSIVVASIPPSIRVRVLVHGFASSARETVSPRIPCMNVVAATTASTISPHPSPPTGDFYSLALAYRRIGRCSSRIWHTATPVPSIIARMRAYVPAINLAPMFEILPEISSVHPQRHVVAKPPTHWRSMIGWPLTSVHPVSGPVTIGQICWGRWQGLPPPVASRWRARHWPWVGLSVPDAFVSRISTRCAATTTRRPRASANISIPVIPPLSVSIPFCATVTAACMLTIGICKLNLHAIG
mmetsp:Transcript_62064/g.90993  ORF Transcript_62064/g.90993 Transcript_62064/m.90993 type:complete len:370 (-) Transcript_62064:279-1388(-)